MRSSSRKNLCTPSLCDHELSDAIKNVSILDVDKSIEVLKNALQNESDILTEDIEFLRVTEGVKALHIKSIVMHSYVSWFHV